MLHRCSWNKPHQFRLFIRGEYVYCVLSTVIKFYALEHLWPPLTSLSTSYHFNDLFPESVAWVELQETHRLKHWDYNSVRAFMWCLVFSRY